MKPRLFIGSSVEQLGLAYALQEGLTHDVEATVWTQGVVELSRSTMANLIEILDKTDFGLFVFAPDDAAVLRDTNVSVVRDNVIFELGLFIGRLGAERSFLIVPAGIDFHLPTDLLSITPATFEANRQDSNLLAALGPACNRIRRTIQRLGAFSTSAGVKPSLPVAEHHAITDVGDILAALQSWMGSRPKPANKKVVRYADVDHELGIALGSTKKYIAEIAQRWNYSVSYQGAETILFNQSPFVL